MAYRYELDSAAALLACRFSMGDEPARDYAQHLDLLELVTRRRADGSPRYAILVVLDRGFPVPDARTRQRVASVTGAEHFDPDIGIVSQSPLVRGVLTALGWLRRQRHEHEVVGDLEQALAWLESRRGGRLEPLRQMAARLGDP